MNEIKSSLSGSVYAEAINGKSGTVRRTYGKLPDGMVSQSRFSRKSESIIDPPIRNLITNAGKDQFFTTGHDGGNVIIGSGTSERDPAMIRLENPSNLTHPGVESASYNPTNLLDSSTGLRSVAASRRTIYAIGKADGIWTEVGYVMGSPVHDHTDDRSMYQKDIIATSLIKDANGIPSSFEVLPDEELRITHTIVRPVPSETIVGSILVRDVLMAVEVTPLSTNDIGWNKMLPSSAYTTNSLGTSRRVDFTIKFTPYVAGSFQRGLYAAINQSDLDVEITYLRFYNGASYLLSFGTPIIKDKDEVAKLGSIDNPILTLSLA